MIQAASTAEPSPNVRYMLHDHLCYTAATSGTLYQGVYVGRSGNSGYTLGSDGTQADPRCSSSDLRGMHIHFGMSKASDFSSGNEYQFGAITDTQVSTHVASTSSLPVDHVTLSNNAGAGYYSYNGANGSSPTVDSWIASTYNSSANGLNFGSTSLLDANYKPCSASTVRWVHGCVWGSHQGIVQTFKSPTGESRALTRESGYTSVFKVEGPVLYAWSRNASILGYATTNRSGTTQTFRGGYIIVTSCQAEVRNASWVVIATYPGIC